MSPLRAIAAILLVAATAPTALSQQAPPTPPPAPPSGGGMPSSFMQVPISNLAPGAAPSRPAIKNPVQGDSNAADRGMKYFISMNCIGCHADNGGGGMGPALSNNTFIYGGQPENIFLSIYQGRPNGMPAWGSMLPDSVIWDLVTYIGRISNEPTPQWGRTFAPSPLSPQKEQVPAEMVSTSDPWSSTRAFSSGRKPD